MNGWMATDIKAPFFPHLRSSKLRGWPGSLSSSRVMPDRGVVQAIARGCRPSCVNQSVGGHVKSSYKASADCCRRVEGELID